MCLDVFLHTCTAYSSDQVVLFGGLMSSLSIYMTLRESFFFGAVCFIAAPRKAEFLFTFVFILCEGHILSIYYTKDLQILSGKKMCLFGVCFCKGRLMT